MGSVSRPGANPAALVPKTAAHARLVAAPAAAVVVALVGEAVQGAVEAEVAVATDELATTSPLSAIAVIPWKSQLVQERP